MFDDQQKNLTGLLRVIKRLKTTRDDFLFYFVGDGKDFETVTNYSKDLGLTNSEIIFTGVLEGQELVDLFYESSFSVLFSNYENIPVVISESLVCGKPFISTNVGGISEHINEKNGILIPANDENALVKSLNYMLDNYMNYDSEGIRSAALKKFSRREIGTVISDYYNTTLS